MSFSSGINKVFLIGHILKDGRKHNSQDEIQPNIHFSLVTEDRIFKNGSEGINQDYHNVKIPGRIAAGKLFLKGRLLYLEGSVKTRSFVDDAGIKHYRSEIWVHRYQLLG